MSAAALIARAEAAGMRLRLEGERVRFTAPAEPPPDLLADLRRHREAVRAALAEEVARLAEPPCAGALPKVERAAAVASLEASAASPAPTAPTTPQREAPTTTRVPAVPLVDEWLASIARCIAATLADGVEREADSDGWLLLIRRSGSRLAVAPHILAELDRAGLLPRINHVAQGLGQRFTGA